MRRYIKIILLVTIIGAVAYGGLCIYANMAIFPRLHEVEDTMETPDIEVARYVVKLVNTGRILYTNSYSKDGVVYTLNDYWEYVNDEFVYRPHTLVLDEKIFGSVLINLR